MDIASSLEDYLEDLEEITITLDGGASKVNFAEAALLIQVCKRFANFPFPTWHLFQAATIVSVYLDALNTPE